MAKSVNKVFLLGNVGKDPEIRSTRRRHHGGQLYPRHQRPLSGRARATGRTAPSGTTLVAFKRTAEIVRDYVKKGSKLFIEGKIQTRSWEDKDTKAKRYRTEIIVNDLSLLSARDDRRRHTAVRRALRMPR